METAELPIWSNNFRIDRDMARQTGCRRRRLLHLAKQALVERWVVDAAFHQRSQAGFAAGREGDAAAASDLLGGAADVAAEHRPAVEERLLDHHR